MTSVLPYAFIPRRVFTLSCNILHGLVHCTTSTQSIARSNSKTLHRHTQRQSRPTNLILMGFYFLLVDFTCALCKRQLDCQIADDCRLTLLDGWDSLQYIKLQLDLCQMAGPIPGQAKSSCNRNLNWDVAVVVVTPGNCQCHHGQKVNSYTKLEFRQPTPKRSKRCWQAGGTPLKVTKCSQKATSFEEVAATSIVPVHWKHLLSQEQLGILWHMNGQCDKTGWDRAKYTQNTNEMSAE